SSRTPAHAPAGGQGTRYPYLGAASRGEVGRDPSISAVQRAQARSPVRSRRGDQRLQDRRLIMAGIFGIEAPKFWTRKLPVIPLNGKVPIYIGWTGNLSSIPNEERQRELITVHLNDNLGLLTGVSFGDDE